MKSFFSLRLNKKVNVAFSWIVLLASVTSVLIQLVSSFINSSHGYTTLIYFTIQSNILVFLIPLLYLLNKSAQTWFKRLAYITLINITITSLVFHVMLTPYMFSVGFLQHMLHTINPLLYIAFYFLFIDSFIPLKQIWISLIYPILYMLFVFGFVAPVLGDLLESSSSFQSARYVYPFLNPNNYENGFVGMLIFNLFILTPGIIILAGIMQYLKKKFELCYH